MPFPGYRTLGHIEFRLVIGDVNLDGEVNLLDIGPMVDHLVSGEYSFEADVNRDGEVSLLDVAPFIDLLVN